MAGRAFAAAVHHAALREFVSRLLILPRPCPWRRAGDRRLPVDNAAPDCSELFQRRVENVRPILAFVVAPAARGLAQPELHIVAGRGARWFATQRCQRRRSDSLSAIERPNQDVHPERWAEALSSRDRPQAPSRFHLRLPARLPGRITPSHLPA